MPELQQVNATSYPSPFSSMLAFDLDLKLSCNALEKYPEESTSNYERLLSDFRNLLRNLSSMPLRRIVSSPS